MIKIFGRQLFFKFHHVIYKYDLNSEIKNCSLQYEKITSDLKRIDIGYFSIHMLEKVLKNNPKESECYMFLSQDKTRVVGFALISYKGARGIHYKVKDADAFVTALGIFPEERGKGYSQEILRGVTNICKSKGLNCLKLSVDNNNHIAINTYEKYGFKKEKEHKFIRAMGIDFHIDKRV